MGESLTRKELVVNSLNKVICADALNKLGHWREQYEIYCCKRCKGQPGVSGYTLLNCRLRPLVLGHDNGFQTTPYSR